MDWSPTAVVQGWIERLDSPIGYILIIIAIVYIYLRTTGKMEDTPLARLFGGKKGGGGQGGQNSGGNRPPDYIIK